MSLAHGGRTRGLSRRCAGGTVCRGGRWNVGGRGGWLERRCDGRKGLFLRRRRLGKHIDHGSRGDVLAVDVDGCRVTELRVVLQKDEQSILACRPSSCSNNRGEAQMTVERLRNQQGWRLQRAPGMLRGTKHGRWRERKSIANTQRCTSSAVAPPRAHTSTTTSTSTPTLLIADDCVCGLLGK